MRERIKIHRGLDLRLQGSLPADALERAAELRPARVALIPDDYPGLTPKADVKAGDEVAVGQPLFHDKECPTLAVTSPCSGRVADVVRGERRKIERIVLDVSPSDDAWEEYGGLDDAALSADPAGLLARSGLLALVRRRPYGIVARPDERPRDIYVTGIDSAPLALDPVEALKLLRPGSWQRELEVGTGLLRKLTDGEVYISCRPSTLPDIAGAVMLDVEGPHPAGLAGTLMAATRPLDKGQTVWTLSLDTLAAIGRLALTGRADGRTAVAVDGPAAAHPRVVLTLRGASLEGLVAGERPEGCEEHLRIVAGNVLTGVKESADGWLRYPYSQVTILAEGDDRDSFLGWASLSPRRHSVSRSFLSWLTPRRAYAPDARLNGGRRAMIMSEVWDRVMPMDIMTEPLVKAMIGRDIDKMERLGAYEVVPEDFALAEYVDPSKNGLQNIVRDALDYLRKNA